MSDEIQETYKWMQLGPEAEYKRKRGGGQVGKRNQVVKRRAGTSVNPCDNLRTEKQMKENRERLPGQNRSMVRQRAATLVDLCNALDDKLRNDRLKQIDCRVETEMSVNLLSQVRNGDANQPGQ